MAELRITGFRKLFGKLEVLPPLDLHVPDGSFTVLVGPSGCGKSTLLRLIAGLEDPDEGLLELDGQDVTFAEPADRGIAMVFQSYALYPHMTVAQNIEFGLKLARVPGSERKARIAEAARALQLEALLDRKPAALSGGQRQRVAIGRAIVRDPRVFLFDEPLSNLDAALRAQMRVELSELHDRLRTTMIYVTHDQVEAMTLADQIVVMNRGRIEQTGTPMELYERPATRFVAEFIGSPRMNMTEGPIANMHGCHALGLRPEALKLAHPETPGAWYSRLRVVERLGAETVVYAHADGFGDLILRLAGAPEVSSDGTLFISPDMEQAHRFGPDGRRLD
jgi:multiple sugar transport system ATP-binding protein